MHQHGITIGRGINSWLNGGKVTGSILFDGDGGGK
jgi:hypothetical protein